MRKKGNIHTHTYTHQVNINEPKLQKENLKELKLMPTEFTGTKEEQQTTRRARMPTNPSQQTTDSSTGKPVFIFGLDLNICNDSSNLKLLTLGERPTILKFLSLIG